MTKDLIIGSNFFSHQNIKLILLTRHVNISIKRDHILQIMMFCYYQRLDYQIIEYFWLDIEYLPADCWQVNWPIVASKFRNIYWSIVIILWMCWCLIMLSEIDMIYVFLLNVLWDAFSKLKIKKNNLNLFSFVCFF